MKQFLIALQFLTIFPVKISPHIKEKDFGASLLYFPLVGLLIGLVLAGSLYLFSFLPPLLRSVLVLILSVIITGGIHLDGFADTCDGLYGNRPKEEILAIMRDSHIGAIGVIGVGCLLLLKFSLFVSIPEKLLWKALILMAIFSRWAQALACLGSSYARQEGKAKYFVEYASAREVIIGVLFTLISFLLLMQLKGLILFIVGIFPISLFINFVKRRIGGVTGDTIGATSELAEVLLLLLGAIILKVNL